MENKKKDPRLDPKLVPSFSEAFQVRIFGSTAMSLIFDGVTLWLIGWGIVYGIGQIPFMKPVYAWTFEYGWWWVQYLLIPTILAGGTIIWVTQRKEGLSVFWWVFSRFSRRKDAFSPFCERPTMWERVRNFLQREEDIYQ